MRFNDGDNNNDDDLNNYDYDDDDDDDDADDDDDDDEYTPASWIITKEVRWRGGLEAWQPAV